MECSRIGLGGDKEREERRYAAVRSKVDPSTKRTEFSLCKQEIKIGMC